MTPIGGVELLIQARDKTEQMAYSAGYDCGKNGANTHNCHFSFFSTLEMTRQWELGKAEAERTKAKVIRIEYGICGNCEDWNILDINSDVINKSGKREIDYRCQICDVEQSWIGNSDFWDSCSQSLSKVEEVKKETRGRKKKQFDQTYILEK